ncbi:MAG: dipeptide ABC transporter ATP-binding protein [Actinobacteria bacterium]|nr:dipeptide ABC transporter ATP-binding protein [Actinomycetota bacterium]
MSSRGGRAVNDTPIAEVKNLQKFFPITSNSIFARVKGENKAVNGISFAIKRGETLGLVGESGCGKSTAGRTILKLYEPTSGEIYFNGENISGYSSRKMKPLRTKMQIIFQDPYSSLNPRHSVGEIIGAAFTIHGIDSVASSKRDIKSAVQELMERVGLNPEHYNRYPHEFSGGQRQRIGIARALALRPEFIVCDEPVSALDVSIQAQVINLLDDLKDDFGLSYLFIAHDLSVVQHISDRVAVMYLGKIVEIAPTEEIYQRPHHPYTKALLSAIPIPDPVLESAREQIVLSGDLPSPSNPPTGCVFNTRCWKAQARCFTEEPALHLLDGSEVACHYPE